MDADGLSIYPQGGKATAVGSTTMTGAPAICVHLGASAVGQRTVRKLDRSSSVTSATSCSTTKGHTISHTGRQRDRPAVGSHQHVGVQSPPVSLHGPRQQFAEMASVSFASIDGTPLIPSRRHVIPRPTLWIHTARAMPQPSFQLRCDRKRNVECQDPSPTTVLSKRHSGLTPPMILRRPFHVFVGDRFEKIAKAIELAHRYIKQRVFDES
jgi:hypothetical protein